MRHGPGASGEDRTRLKHTGWRQTRLPVFEARTLAMGVVKSKSDRVGRNLEASELLLNTDAGLPDLLFCVP